MAKNELIKRALSVQEEEESGKKGEGASSDQIKQSIEQNDNEQISNEQEN